MVGLAKVPLPRLGDSTVRELLVRGCVSLSDEEVAICSLPFTDAVVPHRRLSELDLPVNRDVLVFCKGGVRSAKACRKAAEEWGRGRIFEIGGGIMGWREEVREGGRTNGPTRLSVNTRRCKC